MPGGSQALNNPATREAAGIPDTTTPTTAAAPPGMEPPKEAAAAGQVMTPENTPQVLGDIERLKSKEKNGGLSKDEQIELHHAENHLARAQVTNLEKKMPGILQSLAAQAFHFQPHDSALAMHVAVRA